MIIFGVFVVLVCAIFGSANATCCCDEGGSGSGGPGGIIDCGSVSYNNIKVWNKTGGVFDIGHRMKRFEVFCDTITDGGGWTVFQRRMDGSIDFYRNWDDYVTGFGNPAGEFWLGLEKIHALTKNGNMELRIDMEDWEGETRYASYETFSINDSADNYRLNVGEYSGTAGDSLSFSTSPSAYSHIHANMQFSTSDRDNDGYDTGDCSWNHKGAWWYNNCMDSNLNGIYYDGGAYQKSGSADGVEWVAWMGYKYSLKFVEMKFRRKL